MFNDANLTRARVPRTNSRAQITRVLADILCQHLRITSRSVGFYPHCSSIHSVL